MTSFKLILISCYILISNIHLVFCSLSTKLKRLENYQESIKELGNCGADMAEGNFGNPLHYITLYSNYQEDYDFAYFDKLLIQYFHNRSRWTLKYIPLPVDAEFFQRMEPPRDNFVIFGTTLDSIKHTFTHLLRVPFWHPDGNYILMVLNPLDENDSTKNILNLMAYLWRNQVTKTVLIFTNDPSRLNYKVVAWLPYKNGHCGLDQIEIETITMCNNAANTKTTNIFDDQIPKQLNNCPIRVAAQIWPVHVLPQTDPTLAANKLTDGIEVMLLNTIANQAGFRIQYKLSEDIENWGMVFPNRSSTGMLSMLEFGQADITIGGYWPSRSRYSVFDMSVSYFYDEIKFITHTASSAQRWRSLTTIFEMDTWIMLICSYIFITLTMHFIVMHTRKLSITNKKFSTTAINLWGPIFLTPVNFVIERFKLRLFFILWVFSNFFLNASYQTSLTSVLTRPAFEYQISTIKELIDQEYNFIFNTPVLGFLETWMDDYTDIMMLRSEKCIPSLNCLKVVSMNSNYATLLPNSYYKYEAWKFRDRSGRSKLYLFPHKLMFYASVMYMTKGFPLKKRMDELISKTTEAGLVKRWLQMIYLKRRLSANVRGKKDEDPDPLSLEHLYGIFFIIFIGWTLSLLAILIEFIIYYIRKYKIRKNEILTVDNKK